MDESEFAVITTADTLKEHIESIHSGVRYSCYKCEYTLSAPANLKMHI